MLQFCRVCARRIPLGYNKARTHDATFLKTFAETSRTAVVASVCRELTLGATAAEVGSSSTSEKIQNYLICTGSDPILSVQKQPDPCRRYHHLVMTGLTALRLQIRFRAGTNLYFLQKSFLIESREYRESKILVKTKRNIFQLLRWPVPFY